MSNSANLILSAYLQRRGFLFDRSTGKNSNFSSTNQIALQKPIPGHSDQLLTPIINDYVNFTTKFDTVQQKRLAYLNFLLYNHLNWQNAKIPSKFFRLCFSDQNVLSIDENVKAGLTDFIEKYQHCKPVCEIIDYVLKSCKKHCIFDDHAQREMFISDESLKMHKITMPGLSITSADINIDGKIATGLSDGGISVWSIKTPNNEPTYKISAHQSTVFGTKFLSNHPEYLLSISEDAKIRLWNLHSQQQRSHFDYEGHCMAVLCMDIDHTNQYFISGSIDNKCCLFSCEYRRPLRILAYHDEAVQCVKMSTNLLPGNHDVIVTCGADRKTCIWSIDNPRPVRVYNDVTHYPSVVVCSPVGNLLIRGTVDGKLIFTDMRNDKCLKSLNLDSYIPYSMEFDKSEPSNSAKLYVGGLNHTENDNIESQLDILSIDYDFLSSATSNNGKSSSAVSFWRQVHLSDNTVTCCHVIKFIDGQPNLVVT